MGHGDQIPFLAPNSGLEGNVLCKFPCLGRGWGCSRLSSTHGIDKEKHVSLQNCQLSFFQTQKALSYLIGMWFLLKSYFLKATRVSAYGTGHLTSRTLGLSKPDTFGKSPTGQWALLAKERNMQLEAALINPETLFWRCHEIHDHWLVLLILILNSCYSN